MWVLVLGACGSTSQPGDPVVAADTAPAAAAAVEDPCGKPATDRWVAMSEDQVPVGRDDHAAVWTGSEMLVWGGQQANVPLATGGRYLTGSDTWCPIASDGAPVARRDHAGVWDGRELVVWGGRDPEGDYVATGAAFAP